MRPFASRFLAVSPVERVKRGIGGGGEAVAVSQCCVVFVYPQCENYTMISGEPAFKKCVQSVQMNAIW